MTKMEISRGHGMIILLYHTIIAQLVDPYNIHNTELSRGGDRSR